MYFNHILVSCCYSKTVKHTNNSFFGYAKNNKLVSSCKTLAKKGRLNAVKILAKEVASTRKTIERMYMAKAQLNSVSTSLQTSMCKLFIE